MILTSPLHQLPDGYAQISYDLLENLVFPWYTPLISTAMLKYKRRGMYTMEHYIDPETAAHNIASAFCSREIQNLPDSEFIPGNIEHVLI